MTATANYLAVDLGASSGRLLLGRWDGERFQLEELHRFPNGPVHILGHLHWDALHIWSEILEGLARYASQFTDPLSGISVDAWGVDFGLLDRSGRLLGNPYHYRDSRTDGMVDVVFQKISRQQLYQRTGIQVLQLNTLYQIMSMVQGNDPQLEIAQTLLMMPDLFHYWMTGRKVGEYTVASTTQMLDCRKRGWATDLMAKLGIPASILPEIIFPGTQIGDLRVEILEESGLKLSIPVIATASHDTANAIASISDLDEHSMYISSGTWNLTGVEIGEPILNEQALALNFANEGGVKNTIRFLKIIPGLWLLQECRRHWQQKGRSYQWQELLSLGEQARPFLCLVNTEAPDFNSPGDMPATIQAYCRRTRQPEPTSVGEVVRCCLESLALKTRKTLEDLELATGRHLDTIRIVGGGSQNRLQCQFSADACNRPVVAGPIEATALGNIVLQAIATGELANLHQGRQALAASVERHYYEPHPNPAWDVAYQRYLSLVS
jgi:rhamnulokinase